MRLSELRDKTPPDSLPKLSDADFKLLWHCGFWDGPLSGMLLYAGKEYWFELIQENPQEPPIDWCQRFAVVALSPAELAKEHEVHDDFRKYVGTHSDYPRGEVLPQETHHLFYNRHLEYCRQNNHENSPVVGWFEW